MVAYVILIREQTADKAELELYSSLAPAANAGHPMTPRVIYGAFEVLEGPAMEGAVVLEFPSADEAKAWYGSPAYQAAIKHRHAGARYRSFVIEGIA